MIIHELTKTEQNSAYQRLEYANLQRQLSFMQSMVITAVYFGQHFLSQTMIKSLNYHAIACLHVNAGEYRPCRVSVGTGESQYNPPEHYQVAALMDDFVNMVNMSWIEADQLTLSAYVLWRLNNIHPFINGNGRTARACCYFVLCVKTGGLLPGNTLLPDLLKVNSDRCVNALKRADEMNEMGAHIDRALVPVTELIRELLNVQMQSAVSQQ